MITAAAKQAGKPLTGLETAEQQLGYFAGLSEQEIAELLGRSERSIRRDWQKARLFLLAAMRED